MSGGRGAGSSTRFFLGGWGTVMMGGLEEEGGLSVESGVELESVVMVWTRRASVYMKPQARRWYGARSRWRRARERGRGMRSVRDRSAVPGAYYLLVPSVSRM